MRPPSLHAVLAISALASLHALPLTAAAADPTTGECLSAYERSIKLRSQHELTAAREQLLVCASPSCPEDVRNECASRIAEVSAQLPTLVFEAKDREGNDLVAVTVTMDGAPLVERLDGSALPIDPGEHDFVFSMEGAPSVTKHVLVREGDKTRHESVVLGAEPAPEPVVEQPPALVAAPVAPPLPAPEAAPAPVAPPPSAAARSTTSRSVGIAVAAAGVAALGAAIVEQVNARSHYTDSQQAAVSGDASERARTHGLYVDAEHAQTLAIVIAAAGAVALGTGAYLIVSSMLDTAPRRDVALAPWLSTSGGGVSYAHRF